MSATPIEQLKREALAGLQYHPDDIRAVSAAPCTDCGVADPFMYPCHQQGCPHQHAQMSGADLQHPDYCAICGGATSFRDVTEALVTEGVENDFIPRDSAIAEHWLGEAEQPTFAEMLAHDREMYA